MPVTLPINGKVHCTVQGEDEEAEEEKNNLANLILLKLFSCCCCWCCSCPRYFLADWCWCCGLCLWKTVFFAAGAPEFLLLLRHQCLGVKHLCSFHCPWYMDCMTSKLLMLPTTKLEKELEVEEEENILFYFLKLKPLPYCYIPREVIIVTFIGFLTYNWGEEGVV